MHRTFNIEDINVTNSSALITWDQIANQNYEIEYGIEGFTIVTGTTVQANNTNSKLLTNLIESTNYQYYIKTICSNGNSMVVGPKSFKTICPPLPLPWIEKFDSMTNYGYGLFPDCFKSPNLNIGITSCNAITTTGISSSISGFDDTFYLRLNELCLYPNLFQLIFK